MYKPGKLKNKNELPHELLIKMLQYSSNRGDLVADFFLGGFSTAEVAIGMDRRITGFEINPVSFNHHIRRLPRLVPGSLLQTLRSAQGSDAPEHQRKRWTDQELALLTKRYREIYHRTGRKRQTIQVLQQEFGRGYFSILNQINRLT
jgi:site-specific DNA-methyltransferase (adenine-specific)